MQDRNRPKLLLVLLAALALVAAACGDDGDDGATGTGDGDVPTGGELVIGAEQEPDCVDWISSCAGASWGTWTMGVTTMPRLYDVVRQGDAWEYEPSIVLDGEAELETEPQQVVTYRISDEAVWSDGEPITSTDIKYTWEQITTGEAIYDTTGYGNISSVDDSDPKVAVVTFSDVFADWKGLFGVQYGIYPSHLLEGEDRNAVMKDGYDFSGGPWMIERWNKGVDVTLVPNENYWGEKPKLDKVVFRFITDTAAEFQAFKAGEVSVIYPQPQLDVIDQIDAGLGGAEASFEEETGNLEALWFHNGQPPFDDVDFRRAVAYAIDRDAVVERLFGGLDIDKAVNTLNPPILSFYTDVDAFAGYTRDLDKVDELMTGADWEKGSDGIWARNGERAAFEMKTTAGNKRRELTEQIIQDQVEEAGFEMTINNQSAGDLFGDQVPNGDFQVALYAQVLTSLTPSLCNIMCSNNIPSEENDFSGQNWQRINIPDIDPLLGTVDGSLDEDERAAAQKEADTILADQMVALPLDPLPNILLWSDDVLGPVEDNPIGGPFLQMHQWGLRS